MAKTKRKEREPSDDDEDYQEVESEHEEDDRTIHRTKKNSKKSLKKSKKRKQEETEEEEEEEEAEAEEEEEPSPKKIPKKSLKSKKKRQEETEEEEEEEVEQSPKKGSTKVIAKKQKVKKAEYSKELAEVEEQPEAVPKRKKNLKPGHIQYRCTLISFLNTIKDNKKNISARTLDLLRQSPFGNIVDAFHGGYIEEKSAKKSDDFITLLLQAYNHENDLFFFGKKKFRISTRDISKILGMPAKGDLVPKTSEGAYQSDFVQEFFPDKPRINKKAVEKALQDALKDKPTTEEGIEKKDKNVARLILLDLSIKFLLPNAGGTISWDYVKACENLDKIGSYDWAREVGSFLKKSIKTLKKKKESSSPYGNTGGCVLIILYWFCQKTGKIKPISGRENEDHGMRKWDIQKLIQNWTSFNSLKKLEKIFENLKEDREESESEEEENRPDEAMTAPEGDEKGADDQNCENEEDIIEVEVAEQEPTSDKNNWEKELQKKEEEIRCMTEEKDNLKKKLNEKEQELNKITEEMVNLEVRNATLVTENICLESSVKELEVKLKELEQMLSPKTHTSAAAQQHSSPPPNSTEEKNESKGAASKAAENTEKKDQSTVEEGQSHGSCTVEESAAAAAESPPHCTVAEESQSTPPSHKDSQFQSPTVHMPTSPTVDRPTVAEMEQQPDMFQIVESPIVEQAIPLRTLSIEKELKTPEQTKKEELTMHLTEQQSGETVSSMGLYSYVVRLKNKRRIQKKDNIYWWGDVKAKRQKKAKDIEERLRAAEKKEREKEKKASLAPAERQRLEHMISQQKMDDLPEDVMKAIKEMEAEEQALINKEPKEKQLPPEVVDWEQSKVYNFMDQDTKRRVQKYWQNAPSGVYFWDGRRYGAQISRQDLKDIVMDEPIASNCIECYGILLTDQLSEKESQDLEAPSFMNPLCWHSAENLTVYSVHLYLCEPLFQNLARSNYIFFPISHESGFHHTLLIFDKELKQWFHTDSKRPRKPSIGKCFQNVKKMIEMVELWMAAVKEQANDMLEQGCRMKFDENNSSEEELKMIEVPLTEIEKESIRWIKHNYKQKMEVIEMKDNPQQGEDSLDCGLFVMYTMEKISKKGKIRKNLTKDDILNFRAHVVKSFAESTHSWNSKHNEL
ncbi:hypothetical protein ABKV19_001633 [Rosa sericea]